MMNSKRLIGLITCAVLIAVSTIYPANLVPAAEGTLQRSHIIVANSDPYLSPQRYYAEVDLNNDGHAEILISESLSLSGTGGIPYTLYYNNGDGSYRAVGHFQTHSFALERIDTGNRLWFGSRSQTPKVYVTYSSLDEEGALQTGPAICLYAGDHGSDIGRTTFAAIFNKQSLIQMNIIE